MRFTMSSSGCAAPASSPRFAKRMMPRPLLHRSCLGVHDVAPARHFGDLLDRHAGSRTRRLSAEQPRQGGPGKRKWRPVPRETLHPRNLGRSEPGRETGPRGKSRVHARRRGSALAGGGRRGGRRGGGRRWTRPWTTGDGDDGRQWGRAAAGCGGRRRSEAGLARS